MSTIYHFICWFLSIDWTSDAVTAAATLALAFLTLTLAVGTFFLWLATRRLVKGTEETAERQLRAYIGAHPIGVMGLEDDTPLGVGFTFINHGQTPAVKFNLVGVVDLLPFPLPEDSILPVPPDRAEQDGIIFPNESNPMTGWIWEHESSALGIETKQKILRRDTSQEIYAHGTATYVDIFGITRRTEFCFYLNPASIVRDANGNMQFQWSSVAGRNNVE